MKTPAKNVDAYIEALPKEVASSLEKVRNAICAAAPKAEETISYNLPLYKYHRHLIAFSAFKNHSSLITMSPSVIKKFKSKLVKFKISGTTIHFTRDNFLPVPLIKEIVEARVKENEKLKK